MAEDIIQEARDYWHRCRRDRATPSRTDIDPGDIRHILPNVILIDVLREPLDFRYRLIGTEIDRHSSDRHTGKRISEIPGRAAPSSVWDNLKQVVDTREASETSVPYVGPLQNFVTTRQIVLPLSGDGEEVDMLLVVIDYLRAAADE